MSSSSAISSSNVMFISIEGNIGAGKSTLLTHLKEYLKYTNFENIEDKIIFLKEPIEIWQNTVDPVTGKNMIELFYENPNKWSFAFQVMVFTTQQRIIEETLATYPHCKIIVSERSVEAGRNIFTQLLIDSKNINGVEQQIYNILYENYKFPLHVSIYIDIPPEICVKRIKNRGREGEAVINIDYLKACNHYYREWLIEKKELYKSPEKVYVVKNNDLISVLPILFPIFRNVLKISNEQI
jgi:deoxyadenosine/deoxycytidine kinase